MSTVFDLKITVQPEHIDVLGHVNNVVYLSWMQDAATAHIEALGLGLKEYLELKHAMVAVEHHVQYRKAALQGEEIILRTWLNDINALYSFRQYAFTGRATKLCCLWAIPSGPALKLRPGGQSACRRHSCRLTSRFPRRKTRWTSASTMPELPLLFCILVSKGLNAGV